MTCLFPNLPKPVAHPRRVLAHAEDAGPSDDPDKPTRARFVHKCGFDKWIPCTATEASRGIPCPDCDPDPETSS